jgi:hypothetical protein
VIAGQWNSNSIYKSLELAACVGEVIVGFVDGSNGDVKAGERHSESGRRVWT